MQLIVLILCMFPQPHLQSSPILRVPLIREGTKIVQAVGRLNAGSDEQPIVIELEQIGRNAFDSFIVLPNQRLAEMEAINEEKPESVFRISGEVFAYNHQNFLLVREAVELVEHTDRNRPSVVPIDPNAATVTAEDLNDSVKDIIKDLEEITGPLVRSIRTAANHPLATSTIPTEGTRIVARRCHLVRNDAGAWIAIFVSDATGLSDPPCTVLPGTEFGRLTAWASNYNIETPVLLTGELVNYHGHAFLVLRSWRNVHASDHLDR